MDVKTNPRKWLRPVLIVALAVAVALLAVALNYTVRAERNVRYVGMMNLVAEKLSKTVRGVEMNAENVFDEVAKNMDSPQNVIEALGSKTSLNPDVIGYFAAFVPNYFPQKGQCGLGAPRLYQVDVVCAGRKGEGELLVGTVLL